MGKGKGRCCPRVDCILKRSTTIILLLWLISVVHASIILHGEVRKREEKVVHNIKVVLGLDVSLAIVVISSAVLQYVVAKTLRSADPEYRNAKESGRIFRLYFSLVVLAAVLKALALLQGGFIIALGISLANAKANDGASGWKLSLSWSLVGFESLAILFRLFARPSPLRWRKVLQDHDNNDDANAWTRRFQVLFHVYLSSALCCFSPLRFSCCKHDETNEKYLEEAAQALAHPVALYRHKKINHNDMIRGLYELLQADCKSNTGADEKDGRVMDGNNLSREQMRLVHLSVELHAIVVAPYTGMLMDCGRDSIFGPCQWMRRQFGWCCCYPSKKLVKDDNLCHGHERAFVRFLSYYEGMDLLLGDTGNGICKVGYFLILQRSKKRIILSIRGSQSIDDIITDLLVEPVAMDPSDWGLRPPQEQVETSFGHAHKGILYSTRDLYAQVQNDLIKAIGDLSEERDGEIIILGHSLAASVAFLIAPRIRSIAPNMKVIAFGFNALPCLDLTGCELVKKLNEEEKLKTLGLVFSDDIVSRLSLTRIVALEGRVEAHVLEKSKYGATGFIRKLCATFSSAWFLCRLFWPCIASSHRESSKVSRRGRAFVPGPNPSAPLDQRTEYDKNDVQLALEEVQRETTDLEQGTVQGETHDFYIPFPVVHVRRDRNSELGFKMCSIQAHQELEKVVLSHYMFVDHVPWKLQVALAKCSDYHFQKPVLGNRPRNNH